MDKMFIIIILIALIAIPICIAETSRVYTFSNPNSVAYDGFIVGGQSLPEPEPTPSGFQLFSSTNRTRITTSDNTRWDTSKGACYLDSDIQIFKIKVNITNMTTGDDSAIKKLNFTWEGYGIGYFQLYFVWNYKTSQYDLLGYSNPTSDVTYSLSKDNLLLNNPYINFSNNVTTYMVADSRPAVCNSNGIQDCGETGIDCGGGYCDACGGCPYIYSYDGSEYYMEHVSYPFAFSKYDEYTSYGKLNFLKPLNDEYNIRYSEELYETSYTDNINLRVIDFKNASEIIPADNGTIYTIQTRIKPLSCYDNLDKDCRKEISEYDYDYHSDDLKKFNAENNNRMTMNIDFPLDTDENGAKLLVRAKISDMPMSILTSFIKEFGSNNYPLLDDILQLGLFTGTYNHYIQEQASLKAEYWDGEKWIIAGYLKPKGHSQLVKRFWQEYLLYIPEVPAGKDLKIRLSSTLGFYNIESVQIDTSSQQEIIETKAKLLRVKNKYGEDIITLTMDDDNRLTMNRGDYADLYYAAVKERTGYQRNYVADTKGYYYIDAVANNLYPKPALNKPIDIMNTLFFMQNDNSIAEMFIPEYLSSIDYENRNTQIVKGAFEEAYRQEELNNISSKLSEKEDFDLTTKYNPQTYVPPTQDELGIHTLYTDLLSLKVTYEKIPFKVIVESPLIPAETYLNFNISSHYAMDNCTYTMNSWATNYSMIKINETYFSYTNSSVPFGTYTVGFRCNRTIDGSVNMTTYTFTSKYPYPKVKFVNPTNDDNTAIDTINMEANASIINNNFNITEVKWIWNYTNYTFYDEHTLFMLDFDKGSGGKYLIAADGSIGTLDMHWSLKGLWHMDNGSGVKAKDISGNDNTINLFNTPGWVAGKYGTALDFKNPGSNEYGTVLSDSFQFGSGDFTIGTWFISDAQTDATTTSIIRGEYTNGVSGASIALGIFRYQNRISVHARDQAGAIRGMNTALTDAINWHHIVLVRNSSKVMGYLDGNAFSSTWTAGADFIYNTSGTMWFANAAGGSRFDGKLDEAFIVNYAMTPEEIYRIYSEQWLNETYFKGKYGESYFSYPQASLSFGTQGNLYAPKGTIEFWVKPSLPGNNNLNQMFFDTTPLNNNRMFLFKNTSNDLIFRIYDSSYNMLEVNTKLNANNFAKETWHHIAMTWNETGELELYLDNNLASDIEAGAGTGILSERPALMWIGSLGFYVGVYGCRALMDEFRIYDYTLTADEITQHYYSNAKKFSDSDWRFYTNQTIIAHTEYDYQACAESLNMYQNCTGIYTINPLCYCNPGHQWNVNLSQNCELNEDCNTMPFGVYCYDTGSLIINASLYMGNLTCDMNSIYLTDKGRMYFTFI